jgi:hypothetical protein
MIQLAWAFQRSCARVRLFARSESALASNQAPVSSPAQRLADEVPLDSASWALPRPGPRVRQDYGLGAHTGEGDHAREINNLRKIARRGYGLGPAKICFRPHQFAQPRGRRAWLADYGLFRSLPLVD